MTTKRELLTKIISDLIVVQGKPEAWHSGTERRDFGLPPDLYLGDGRTIRVTEEAISAAGAFARILIANDHLIQTKFTKKEFDGLVKQHLAVVLATLNLEKNIDDLVEEVIINFQNDFPEKVLTYNNLVELTLGGHLINNEDMYPLKIGPVEFLPRQIWLKKLLDENKISNATFRRVSAQWIGSKLKKRKISWDSNFEDSIIKSIGRCPIVCSVSTSNLASNFRKQKGLLAARIAMTAVSLVWQHPSKSLSRTGLLYDGLDQRRHTIIVGSNGVVGTESSTHNLAVGIHATDDFKNLFVHYKNLFEEIGLALLNWTQPQKSNSRPNMMNALFLSLFWYNEACKDESDLVATTKFAASMDALTKGKKSKGIARFIESRLGLAKDQSLMKDGRNATSLINLIYNKSRSELIHGNSTDYGYDWDDRRNTAEELGRLCILTACDWMSQNPNSDDLDAMQQP